MTKDWVDQRSGRVFGIADAMKKDLEAYRKTLAISEPEKLHKLKNQTVTYTVVIRELAANKMWVIVKECRDADGNLKGYSVETLASSRTDPFEAGTRKQLVFTPTLADALTAHYRTLKKYGGLAPTTASPLESQDPSPAKKSSKTRTRGQNLKDFAQALSTESTQYFGDLIENGHLDDGAPVVDTGKFIPTSLTEKVGYDSQSIVDFLKSRGLPYDLEHRQAMALHRGYRGNPLDTARLNTWLLANLQDAEAKKVSLERDSINTQIRGNKMALKSPPPPKPTRR